MPHIVLYVDAGFKLPAYQRSWRASKAGEMERSGTEGWKNNEELTF